MTNRQDNPNSTSRTPMRPHLTVALDRHTNHIAALHIGNGPAMPAFRPGAGPGQVFEVDSTQLNVWMKRQ